MNNSPNIFTSNSRYLPPPIRSVNQSDCAYRRSDCQRAAAFLNQDWTPTPATAMAANSLTEPPSSPSSSDPPPPRSDSSHSEDDSEEDCDASSSCAKREPFSPEPPFNFQQRLPHILPDRRASLSMNDLQSVAARRHSASTDSSLVSRSLGNGPPSLDRRVRSSPYSAYHHQTRSWPTALHPSAASDSQPAPSGSGHRRNLSGNSHSTGSPPQTPTSPSSPALSAKNESAPSSSTASPPATVNTDEYIQRIGGGKSKCVWNDVNGSECGFQSSSSLVKRHVRTVHLKIRYVSPFLHWTVLTILSVPLSAPSAVKASRPSSTSKHTRTSSAFNCLFFSHTRLLTIERHSTGQKPYSCPDCSKTFSNPSSRHHHRVRYHGYVQSWRHYGDKNNEKN